MSRYPVLQFFIKIRPKKPEVEEDLLAEAPALNFSSQKISKNPLKRSKHRSTAAKRVTKKEPRVTQMNHSGLSNFTHVLSRNLLRKGQNWDKIGSGFGWGENRESQRNSFVGLIIT